jgi:catechol 2,3-dioxygenase-like lactoylglutathione lyase family enzyme
MLGTIHHLDLTVRDPWMSRPFYDAVLGFLGYRLSKEDRRGFDWDLVGADGRLLSSIGVVQAEGAGAGRQHDRYSPGLHHVAWTAESRADVDAMHSLLLRFGATVLDAPGEYSQYQPGYYAVFFTDPDGIKLEVVHTPALKRGGPQSSD